MRDSSDDDKENRTGYGNNTSRRRINEDKTLKGMKGALTRDTYFVWRSRVLTHMDARHAEMANHIMKMEKAKVEDAKGGKYDLSPSQNAQLLVTSLERLDSGKSGLSHHLRKGDGILTWKLIYDVLAGDKVNTATQYRRWLGTLFASSRPKKWRERRQYSMRYKRRMRI